MELKNSQIHPSPKGEGLLWQEDKYGTRVNIQQARNGKIFIPIGKKNITLSKEDAEQFTLYDIEGFDVDLYRKAYL